MAKAKLHKIIKNVLNEGGHLYYKDKDGVAHTNSTDTWHGVKGTTFISHGEWADPEVWYDGEEINGSFLEENAWEYYCYECESDDKKPSEQEYNSLPSDWFEDYLDYEFMPAFKGE